MLESAALVGFVGVSDLVRARHFYGDQLGLSLRDETPFALVAEAGGTMLRITAVDDVAPTDAKVLGLLRACPSARDKLIVLLMARAGLRRGEAVDLRRVPSRRQRWTA